MAKVKVETISNTKMNKICKEAKSCDNCPLVRYSKEGRRIWCYRRCRAWFYANKIYYGQLLENENLTEHEREYHEAMWEKEQKEQAELEREEIDLNV